MDAPDRGEAQERGDCKRRGITKEGALQERAHILEMEGGKFKRGKRKGTYKRWTINMFSLLGEYIASFC